MINNRPFLLPGKTKSPYVTLGHGKRCYSLQIKNRNVISICY